MVIFAALSGTDGATGGMGAGLIAASTVAAFAVTPVKSGAEADTLRIGADSAPLRFLRIVFLDSIVFLASTEILGSTLVWTNFFTLLTPTGFAAIFFFVATLFGAALLAATAAVFPTFADDFFSDRALAAALAATVARTAPFLTAADPDRLDTTFAADRPDFDADRDDVLATVLALET